MISEPIDKAIGCTGSQDALAKQCGVSQATVWKWRHGKRVKAEHVLKIVAAANGQVAAYEIRPDLPELFPHPTQGE
ncbi:helix-turn-helix domain-containing protein [Klebsiella pneumoniae]|uniref:transcriptional regulator n=1 Tax=Klebsiella pneumoniae TaxID=573 RepID=UPI00211795AB|nr:YdaS family helix-turn-helix protein [Klebsiella pneumoniae]MCQ8497423.1 helix-turn-helix domain-containing protein [Klebsiella pneumoniae]HCE8967044.1 helix-turn-helix domain-containing protein [Klebsiella pneumoniae]HCG2939262.1 helix-turn-helix domain-containing protein [Klebsiella pneumoniae]HCH7873113.1 helix-turn-helix domain-containing protein [Klebsiella pneumoniae]